MGRASYDAGSRSLRSEINYKGKQINEIFDNTETHDEMSPSNVAFRESRDSDIHPQSFPIIIGLDETGSMGQIPHYLIQDGLPKLVTKLMEVGVESPAILFLGIGDHKSDRSPLQIGQFESGDEELDKWLENIYLEGNGGGNGGESYPLAWYFAGYHTKTDHYEKRGEKGILITVGDEPMHNEIPIQSLRDIMGDSVGVEDSVTAKQLYDKASEMYDIYHINIEEGYRGKDDKTINSWKEVIGDNFISISTKEQIVSAISGIFIDRELRPNQNQTTDSDEEVEIIA